ncbi:hypothetical protein [Agaribacter flavus]|uniref:Flagellar protein FliT n=1 Tax=Agaribacter flavus TaxID=1902781 RepID=A0ABV7FNG4_9ALTE
MPSDKLNRMTFPELAHEYSPEALTQVNESLIALAHADPLDIDKLSDFARERAVLVENLLTTLTKDEQQRFVPAEMSINRQLEAYFSALRQDVKKEILGVAKGKNAVNQYTGQHAKLHKVSPSR